MLSWEVEAMVGYPPQAGVRAKRGGPCEKLPGPLGPLQGLQSQAGYSGHPALGAAEGRVV